MLEPLNIYLIIIAVITLAATFILDRIMSSHRDMTYFRMLLPSTMHFIHCGAMLNCLCVILVTSQWNVRESSSSHFRGLIAAAWMFHSGFWLMQGTLMIKAWRTHRVCVSGMKRIRITNGRVALMVLVGLSAFIAYLTATTVALGTMNCFHSAGEDFSRMCSNFYYILNLPLLLAEATTILMTMYFAWKSRSAPEGFHDTSNIVNATLGSVTAALVVFPAAAAVSYVELRLQIVSLGILASVAQTLMHTTGAQVIVMVMKKKWFSSSSSKLAVSSPRNTLKRGSVVQVLRGLQRTPPPAMNDLPANSEGVSRVFIEERELMATSSVVATAAGAHTTSFSATRNEARLQLGNQNSYYEKMQQEHGSSKEKPPFGAAVVEVRSRGSLNRDIRLAENWWLESQCQEVINNVCKTDGTGDFRNVSHAVPMINVVQRSTRDDRELLLLIDAIQVACKAISRKVTDSGSRSNVNESEYGWDGKGSGRGTLRDDVQGAKSTNGRQKRQLDLLANQIFAKALFYSHCCCVIVSSEISEPLIVPERMAGEFCVAYHPLNGSSNVDCNVSVGTIFSIWRKTSPGPATVEDIRRPGREMICAGYCMYSFSTELVITFGKGVKRFTLDAELKNFHLSDNFVTIPREPERYYSVNEGNMHCMDSHLRTFIYNLKHDKERPYSLRYIGSMVADVHRTITFGGIFMYPTDKKKMQGKLRVLYECAPLAMIVEQAGGEATTGMFNGEITNILDIEPTTIHETCPIVVACARDMTKLRDAYNADSIQSWLWATKSAIQQHGSIGNSRSHRKVSPRSTIGGGGTGGDPCFRDDGSVDGRSGAEGGGGKSNPSSRKVTGGFGSFLNSFTPFTGSRKHANRLPSQSSIADNAASAPAGINADWNESNSARSSVRRNNLVVGSGAGTSTTSGRRVDAARISPGSSKGPPSISPRPSFRRAVAPQISTNNGPVEVRASSTTPTGEISARRSSSFLVEPLSVVSLKGNIISSSVGTTTICESAFPFIDSTGIPILIAPNAPVPAPSPTAKDEMCEEISSERAESMSRQTKGKDIVGNFFLKLGGAAVGSALPPLSEEVDCFSGSASMATVGHESSVLPGVVVVRTRERLIGVGGCSTTVEPPRRSGAGAGVMKGDGTRVRTETPSGEMAAIEV